MAVAQERLVETIAFRVTRPVYAFIESVMSRERRELAEVGRALLDRGIAAYKRDGLLFEPEKPTKRPPKQ
jgi:hypothetical protein